MNNTILAKMAVQIAANTAEFNKGLGQASAGLNKFTSDIGTMAATLATAFSVQQVGQFILEMNKLSGTFEGVQRAFDRLPNSTLLMEKLRESTHGTVDELTLMQQALRAKNFGISVKDLGTYLEFAAIRAQQTGESIDYMVNSIILGLGRGSIKILDNLQVNIAKIKDTVKETGVSLQEAFRQQVIDQMQSIGGYAETAATSVSRLEVAFKALRLEVAKKVESGGFLDQLTKGLDVIRQGLKAQSEGKSLAQVQLEEQLEKVAVRRVKSFTDNLKGLATAQQEEVQQEINTLVELLQKRNLEIRKVDEEIKRVGPGLDALDRREQLYAQKTAMLEANAVMKREIELLKEYFTTLQTGSQEAGKELGIIAKLRQDIENEEEFLNAAKTEEDVARSVAALKTLNAELDRLLGRQKKTKGPAVQFLPDLEAEGSTNPELRNQQEEFRLKEFSKELMSIATTADFAGGALIQLNEGITEYKGKAAESIEITGMVAAGISNLADAFLKGVGSAKNFGKAILEQLASFAQQFGALLIATGLAKISFDKFSGPQMVLAGVGLIAAAGLVKRAISSRPSLGGSGNGGTSFPDRYASVNGQLVPLTTNELFQNFQLTTNIAGTDLGVVMINQGRRDKYTKP